VLNQSTDLAPPIVIVGAQRSGTTLLRTILGAHPQLLEFPREPQFFLGLYERFGYGPIDRDAAIDLVIQHPYHAPEVKAFDLRFALRNREQVTAGDLANTYLRLWTDRQPASGRSIIKHPRLVFYLDQVRSWLPSAVFVHVVRDPRANVASQRARWRELSLWACIAWWRDAIRAARKFSSRFPAQMTEIEYERMVLEPERAIAGLCDFLGIPFQPEMLHISLQTHSYSPGKPAEAVHFRELDPSRLTRWQTQLTTTEVALIEQQCAREMAVYGYSPSGADAPSWRTAALIMRDRPVHELKRLFRRLRSPRSR
jgi:hypothetical protein